MLNNLFMFIGSLLIIGGLGMGLSNYLSREKKFSIIVAVFLAVLGIVFLFFDGTYFYAEPGYSYLVQYPTGRQVAVTQPGYHMKWWGNLIPFRKVVTVKFDTIRNSEFSGMEAPYKIRFIDAVTADVKASFRFRLPNNAEKFRKIAVDYRSQENLVLSSLVPSTKEVLRNSARILSAQEYISGKGGEFENAVMDQLQNGIYTLEIEEKEIEDEKIEEVVGARKIGKGKVVKYDVQIKRRNGEIIRKKHSILDYGITVVQSTIESVDPEKRFKEMLGQQRDAAAQASIEKEKAKQAEYRKQRIIAEGEAEKAQIQVEQEKEQIKRIVSAETQKKQAKIEAERKQIEKEILIKTREAELRAAELEAKAIKLKADALAYEKEKIMKADGALEKKLQAWIEVNKIYAEALTGAKLVPDVVMDSGNSTGGSSSAMDILELLKVKTAKDLQLNFKVGE
ncbi:SPFH domain-containing protein [Orenia marismortui]|uniref:SPFH domain/Band 7 family protein n=1 Tax=Orenia marismortui TaxID=46469 RepID=A0A4R8H4A8_9FIRM|nr:SPFH domain-containing protein [Orenia marismortui]TDX51631.1 SPFH domain/Band 7 family protein [Orenia marismortui]